MEEKIKSISKCQCSGCGRFFVGTSIFDMHRTGKYEQNGRRCHTSKAMQASGFATEQRCVKLIHEGKPCYEEHPVWYSIAAREQVRQAFGRSDEEPEEEEELEPATN